MIEIARLAASLVRGLFKLTTMLGKFWHGVTGWIVSVADKLKTLGNMVEGATIFFARMQGVGKELSKNYSRVGTKWQEITVKKTLGLEELPPEYAQRMIVEDQEYEFTDELQNLLES